MKQGATRYKRAKKRKHYYANGLQKGGSNPALLVNPTSNPSCNVFLQLVLSEPADRRYWRIGNVWHARSVPLIGILCPRPGVSVRFREDRGLRITRVARVAICTGPNAATTNRDRNCSRVIPPKSNPIRKGTRCLAVFDADVRNVRACPGILARDVRLAGGGPLVRAFDPCVAVGIWGRQDLGCCVARTGGQIVAGVFAPGAAVFNRDG